MNPSKLTLIGGKFTTKEICRKRANSNKLLEYANKRREVNAFNDVTIEVGNEKFPANRMVLSCYSKFFERMFETELKEKYQDSVEIKHVDEITMKTIIDFIYTDSIKINTENVCCLLDASEFLQLDDSKQFCFEFLESAISVESYFIIHELSDRYGNDDLKVKVKRFIDDNFDEIIAKDDFKNLSKNQVEICISNLDRNKVSIKKMYEAIIGWTRFDVGNRRSYLYDLLALVDLSQLRLIFLEEVASKEELIAENFQCKMHLQSIVKYKQTIRIKEKVSKILSLGGSKSMFKCKDIFNLSYEPVKTYPNLPEKRSALCSVVLNDCVYLIGGRTDPADNATITNSVYRMNLKEEVLKWDEVSSLNEKRCVMGAAVLNGLIFVVGGMDELGKRLSCGEYFTPTSNKWQNIAPMKQSRSGNALVSCNGCIYAIGGYGNNTYLDSVEQFQPGSEVWDDVTSLQVRRCWLAAVVEDDVIYAIGGQSGKENKTRLKSVEKYDFTNKTWSYIKEMNVKRSACSACVLHGNIYVSGGVDERGDPVELTECYNASLDQWKIIVEAGDILINHAIVAV